MTDYNTISHVIPPVVDRITFLKGLKGGQITIVKAYATWCKPCRDVSPLVDKLLSRMAANVKIMYVDVDQSEDLTRYLQIKQLPTFISFVGRDKMDIQIGSDENNVRSFFRKVEAYNLRK